MARQFDLVVLGTGTAGSVVANKTRKAGWDVAIVDPRPYGGTCALRGCDPKKVLVEAATAIDSVRRLRGKGVTGDSHIDWRELMRFKRTFTDPVPDGRERGFTEAGIATLHGPARFVGPTSVEVDGERLDARHVHIATGAKPADLPIEGAEHLITSDGFLELEELPKRIVFLGSGYIAFEFAHVAATAGATVTMVEMLDRPLAGFDADLVALLVERTRALGIDLHLRTRVESIEQKGEGFLTHASAQARPVTFESDIVVHSAGRVPDIGDLDLDAGDIRHEEGGVEVNEYMQSVSNPAVYAAGDVAHRGLPLTPIAGFEAYAAAANLLEGNHRQADYPPIPSVVFSLPPLAAVGMGERQARDEGLKFTTNHARTSSWATSRRVAEEASGYKVLVEEETGRILGAHLLGPHAEDLINLFAMAMRCGMTSPEIKKTIFAYPTAGSDIAYMV